MAVQPAGPSSGAATCATVPTDTARWVVRPAAVAVIADAPDAVSAVTENPSPAGTTRTTAWS